MKLYSRGQMIFYSSAATVILVLLLIGLGIIDFKGSNNNKNNTSSAALKTQEDEFVYKTTVTKIPSADIILAQDSSHFQADELANIKIYKQLNEAVVNISTEIVTYNWFLEPVPTEGGSGSGAIIDTRGYILTNRHVVAKAYKVYVTLADGSQFEGNVIGVDPENDLAVVKIEPLKNTKLVTIPMGDSYNLLVGQKVLAIGNPFGYERTLTIGVISGLGRPVQPTSESSYIVKDMIQTDASINPGNSGGPLIDSSGKMIGINTMIYSPTGGSIGIGFAVPVDTAKRVVPDLIKYGRVKRGWIDIEPIQLFPELVRYGSLPVKKGILVSRVQPNSFAEKAGIQGGKETVRYGRSTFFLGGDIIIETDGMNIDSIADFYSALEDNKPGDTVIVKLLRGTRKITLKVELSDRHRE